MEYYQNPVVIQDPARQPVPVGLQVTALVLGIVGFVMSFICYFIAIFGNVMRAVAYNAHGSAGSGVGVIVLGVITLLLCAVAIILGIVGLVRSIRRPRTVKGIVFSALGLSFGIGGVIFAFISLFFNGMFTAVMHNIY